MEFDDDPLKNVVIIAQDSENPNPQPSKIAYVLPVYGLRNARRIHHISDPRVKFGELQKSDFYFRFHSPLNTKSALLNFISIWDLVLIAHFFYILH